MFTLSEIATALSRAPNRAADEERNAVRLKGLAQTRVLNIANAAPGRKQRRKVDLEEACVASIFVVLFDFGLTGHDFTKLRVGLQPQPEWTDAGSHIAEVAELTCRGEEWVHDITISIDGTGERSLVGYLRRSTDEPVQVRQESALREFRAAQNIVVVGNTVLNLNGFLPHVVRHLHELTGDA